MNKQWTVLATMAGSLAVSQAAISLTNGGFGSSNRNGGVVDGGGWFESGTANWVEGSWSSASTSNPDDGGDAILLLMDGGSTTMGYIYQSLGTVSAADIALGQLQLTADFAEKSDGESNSSQWDFYVGSFGSAANGSDIDASLPSQHTIVLDAVAMGLTYERGNTSRQNGVSVGSFDISGLSEGDEVWLRIGETRDAAFQSGDLMIDNVSIEVVPEPSSFALIGLGAISLVLRRRR
ncbi:PEP-CTERM sorting domain-containing protein [Oceaniferula marina]|nr:PEP-CTERM sorting domain-containing protein [Oceaniferula marina]